MMQYGRSSDRAWSLMDQIRQSIGEFEPSTSAEQVLNPFASDVRLSPDAFGLVLHRFGENQK